MLAISVIGKQATHGSVLQQKDIKILRETEANFKNIKIA
jgi:hypothetical protein